VVQLGEKALFRFMVTFAKIYSFLGVDAEILSANALNLESMSAETVVTSKEGGGGLVIWSHSRGIKL